MEMQETERELRRTMDHLDPRPARSVASSAPPASSHIRRVPPSNEPENSIQPPTVKPDTSPTGNEAAGNDKGKAENNNPEEHG